MCHLQRSNRMAVDQIASAFSEKLKLVTHVLEPEGQNPGVAFPRLPAQSL